MEKLFNRFNEVNEIKFTYFFLSGISLLLLPILISLELYKFIFVPIIVFLLIPFLFYFSKYYIQIFTVFLFLNILLTWKLRLFPVSLISFSVIFLYILNLKSGIFNDFLLPRSIKVSASLVIISVFLSSVITPFVSWLSIYYAFVFLALLLFSYVIFRSIKYFYQIEYFFSVFVVSVFVSSLIIFIEIILTKRIRSLGLAGFPIMDFSAIALIIIFFFFYLFGNNKRIVKIATPFIVIILITTQSRFAWLGFFISSIYGIIISVIYKKDVSKLLFKKVPIITMVSFLFISIFFVLGLDRIILSRIMNIDFNFFQGSEQGALISNSLETRILIWIVAINTFVHNPFFGVGYLMFSEISDAFNIIPIQLFDDFVKGLDAHTTFLNILCETGIIGLILFLFYFITIFTFSFKAMALSRGTKNIDTSIILNILIFFILIHSVYSGAFTYGANAYYMHFIFGVAIANYYMLKKNIDIQLIKKITNL
jgi:O-antigen ligase